MEDLSFLQKIAVLRILMDIISADGRIDARETFYFNKVSEQLHIADKDRQCVDDANSLLCLLEIKNLTDVQKKEVAKMMGQQIVVDEDINVNEMAIYELVCDTCGINVKFEDIVTPEQLENSTRS